MIQYRLIKEYPGSQKLGVIENSCSHIGKGTIFYDAQPEYWQKVEELQYEVGKWYRNTEGLFCVTKVEGDVISAYGFSKEIWLEVGFFSKKEYQEDDVLANDREVENALICEAKKRGFDFGVKFKEIDDIQNVGIWDKSGKVGSSFILSCNNLYTYGYGEWCIFKDGKWAEIIEQKTPLFTTEDGVAIFKGDTFWFVGDEFTLNRGEAFDKGIRPYVKHFSTKEKAEEYIRLNQKRLSLMDVLILVEQSSSFLDLKNKINER